MPRRTHSAFFDTHPKVNHIAIRMWGQTIADGMFGHVVRYREDHAGLTSRRGGDYMTDKGLH